jgi:hypothetical protein
MHWARILAYITGSVDQELLLRNEYLVAENRTPHLFASAFFRRPLEVFFRGSFDCKIVDVRSRV